VIREQPGRARLAMLGKGALPISNKTKRIDQASLFCPRKSTCCLFPGLMWAISLACPVSAGQALGPDSRTVTYELRQTAAQSEIRYSLPYLDIAEQGEDVGAFGDAIMAAPMPRLPLRMPDDVQQKSVPNFVLFDVRLSSPNNEPVILASGDLASPWKLVLRNQGWSTVTDARLTILGWAKSAEAQAGCAHVVESAGSSAQLHIGVIDGETTLDLSSYMPPELRTQSVACVSARLDYTWGASRRGSFAFAAPLQQSIPAPAPSVPGTELFDLLLPCKGEPYEAVAGLPLAVQTTEPGRFVFKLWTDRTCTFELNAWFLTADQKKIPLGDFKISIFVPRFRGVQTGLTGAEQITIGKSTSYLPKHRDTDENAFR
jgi:hypothetical protein